MKHTLIYFVIFEYKWSDKALFLKHLILIFSDLSAADTHLREKKPSFRADAQTTANGRWE